MKQLSKIPFTLRVKTLFSSKFVGVGFFILMIPTIILVGFLPHIDFMNSRYEKNHTAKVDGKILSIHKTNSSVNGKQALEFRYEFKHENQPILGQSYGFDESFQVGDQVEIEYIANDETVSRIIGTKNGAFDIGNLEFLLGFIFVGLLVLFILIYPKIKILKLLKSGFDIVPSKLQSEYQSPIIPVPNIKPIYRLKFDYNASGNTYNKVIYTSRDQYSIARIRMSNIVVDTHNRNNAFVLETLPIKMRDYIIEKISLN
ncbi:hypothetical protein [Marinifilum caeruleilacunae]|uniref:DUF3592 domain-containing protein n=1 Tax=Marinifilum caeruleilacunae TaxID=2499076 RepID=A0ABX1WZ05_9BACT|nr:hypothetical protein [Marinifilum caeruleilacunae]NOU61383.1 hypothetical protein [Marinifilum caeruleilacunae]